MLEFEDHGNPKPLKEDTYVDPNSWDDYWVLGPTGEYSIGVCMDTIVTIVLCVGFRWVFSMVSGLLIVRGCLTIGPKVVPF